MCVITKDAINSIGITAWNLCINHKYCRNVELLMTYSVNLILTLWPHHLIIIDTSYLLDIQLMLNNAFVQYCRWSTSASNNHFSYSNVSYMIFNTHKSFIVLGSTCAHHHYSIFKKSNHSQVSVKYIIQLIIFKFMRCKSRTHIFIQ